MTETTKTKEQAILAAAEQEFLAKGFDGARTTSIAAAAGVTHAMLHYYFRTKENIFERILDEKLRLMGESVLAAFGDPALPFLERIQEGLSRHFDFTAANPPCRFPNGCATASNAISISSRPIPTCRVSSSMKSRRSPSVTT